MTNSQLKKFCKEWQKRLRLQDWNVSVAFGILEDSTGLTKINPNFKVAKVIIDEEGNNELEITLVHELLHLHADPFSQDLQEKYKTNLEAMIELTARALVEAKYENNK